MQLICEELFWVYLDILFDIVKRVVSNISHRYARNSSSIFIIHVKYYCLEINEESERSPRNLEKQSNKLKPGCCSCPVVAETHFILHPRLKTGSTKSGLSMGILALKTILDKFSVTNRNNMFVYQDKNMNVFYLRYLISSIHQSK